MKAKSLRSGAYLAVWLMLIAVPASAATISTDTVLGPDHPFPNETITVVDGDTPPTHVTILDGAIIGGIPGQSAQPIGIDVFGQSEIEMLGGFLMGERPALMHDHSVFRMSGGETHLIEARDQSKVKIEGGSWGAVWGFDSSRIRINGPQDGNSYSLRTFGESHAVIVGDELDLIAAELSTVVVRGGEFHMINATGNAVILVDGGVFSDSSPSALDDGVVHLWSLASIADEPIIAADSGIVNIYGTDLRFEVFDDHGNLKNIIVGKLTDGDDFESEYRIFDQGQIILHEVPEPGTWALAAVAMGLFGVFAGRR